MKLSDDHLDYVLKAIKDARIEKGYSNENIAYELDISPSTYNKIERNEINLSLKRLIKLMNILDISGEKLFPSGEGRIINQQVYDNGMGYVEKYYHDNKELYGKVVEAKDKLIARLEEENRMLRNK